MLIGLIKQAILISTGAGTGMIVTNIVKATTPIGIGRGFNKFLIEVGSFALSAFVANTVSEYTVSQFEDVVSSVTDGFSKFKREDDIKG